ncbi:helix-turn-helix transcriptional regulator [Kitasatospora viridis]|uniref:Regulatory LuxR family protein n=1 Tax=Kitasatospora viridis TaxID=281105 RepID=A0A561T6G0_9ACTN|nr:LuxR family transcriptional regulator [Kitasatospora viridis]TWF82693.1 regulatory LuxR family protein [Kitasatospora viridis]
MRTTSSATVGRDAEIALLSGLVTGLRSPAGKAVFLLGEAGIGKSRLVEECAARAGELGLPVLRGRGRPTGAGTPFRPLAEALASRLRVGGPPTDPELLPYRPALARLVPEWRQAPGAHTHFESLVELAEALLRLLAVLGRQGGCVLLLEDLHDADSETIAVAEYLVDNLAGLPVLLLATLRPEPSPALELARAADRRRAAAVTELRALEPSAVRALAAGCLGTPADRIPAAVVARLVDVADGNPYLIEELLAEMVGSGLLREGPQGWQVVGDLSATLPATVVRGYGQRIARLDPQVREVVLLAASLGVGFSVAHLRVITGHDDRALFAHLRAAAEAGLIVPDPAAPFGYMFRHALTGEAVLAGLPPAERAAIARHAAAALHRADPELPDDRCQLVAGLLVAAGHPGDAALLFAEAGRRALADGMTGSAVLLLQRGHELAAPASRPAITESLLYALTEAGQLDAAVALAQTLPSAGAQALDHDRRIALRTRLAWAAVAAERPADAVEQAALARELLGPGGTPEQLAALAVVEGHLALLPGQHGRAVDAERLVREAVELAERAKLPVLACQSWQVLALLSRELGFEVADSCLERMLAVAEANSLPQWRVEALMRLGVNAFLRTGEGRRIEQARESARELGALALTQEADAVLALRAVLRGDPGTAGAIVERCLDPSERMHNIATHRYLLLIAATLEAHRGRRREMDKALLRFDKAGGGESMLVPLMHGLCRAVCALLEEDRETARAELAASVAWEERHPNLYYLSGRYGLRPLLAVLPGAGGRAEYAAAAAAPVGRLAWNRQFLRLAEAVVLGREGRAAEAARAVEEVGETAGVFPTGYHLGLRLVAEAALADGWGEPVAWLRTAEEYFHELDVPAVAAACRALLRQAGANVGQRRSGRELIPAELRAQGLTPREYEVLELLPDCPGNQGIARRLFISPRTVEKHVASLLRKTGRPDRAALCRLAVELCDAGGGRPPAGGGH